MVYSHSMQMDYKYSQMDYKYSQMDYKLSQIKRTININMNEYSQNLKGLLNTVK